MIHIIKVLALPLVALGMIIWQQIVGLIILSVLGEVRHAPQEV